MSGVENIQRRRSFIFCPGNKPEMFAKALGSGADIVCVDLEDAIAPQHKNMSRENALRLFKETIIPHKIESVIRVNELSSKDGQKDILQILSSDKLPSALMLPKVKNPDEVIGLEKQIIELKININLHIIIETNEALEFAWEIAQCSNLISSLFFGGVDMSAELGCNGDWHSLLYARSRIVHAASGAGIEALDVPYLDLDDIEGMKKEALLSKNLGFSGKGTIHPKQIPIMNEIFSPSVDEINYAKKVIDAFDKADGGLVVVDGKLIEKPVLRSVKRVLANVDETLS